MPCKELEDYAADGAETDRFLEKQARSTLRPLAYVCRHTLKWHMCACWYDNKKSTAEQYAQRLKRFRFHGTSLPIQADMPVQQQR